MYEALTEESSNRRQSRRPHFWRLKVIRVLKTPRTKCEGFLFKKINYSAFV